RAGVRARAGPRARVPAVDADLRRQPLRVRHAADLRWPARRDGPRRRDQRRHRAPQGARAPPPRRTHTRRGRAMNRLRTAAALAAALLLAACGGPGSAESADEYPSDQIRLIVPYTAGGPTDIAARALGRYMEGALGQTVVVEDLPGASGSAAECPSGQGRLIVPCTAGGPADVAARALGRYMEGALGQTVVVENLPGASGSTAYQELLSAEPDGYTLSMSALPTAVLNYLTH